MPASIESILLSVHPDYVAAEAEWRRNEARFEASEAARDELDPFQWEGREDDSYTERRAKAMCPPLLQQAAEKFSGPLFEEPPLPDMGALGVIRGVADRTGQPTRAELVYDNTDGVGSDARGWDAWWRGEVEASVSTGHRWGMVELPVREEGRAYMLADEIAGFHPYLVSHSPLSVPDWHFTAGRLDYARIVVEEREPRLDGDTFTTTPVKRHLLLVREGYAGFGAPYDAGGWWLIGDESKTVETSGAWTDTGGQIPMWRLYYNPRSRGLTDLGSAAVAAMNLLSALYNDALVSGARRKWAIGASKEAHAVAVGQIKEGSLFVTIPADPKSGTTPSLVDDGATSANGAITAAIEYILKTAAEIIVRELATSPDASGAARQLQFLQGSSPRLASMATFVEDAQWTAIRFLQMRWGVAEGGGVQWKKRYDLRSLLEKAMAVLGLLADAAGMSPTLVADLVVTIAEREGFLTDDAPAETVRAELLASLQQRATQGQRADALADDLLV